MFIKDVTLQTNCVDCIGYVSVCLSAHKNLVIAVAKRPVCGSLSYRRSHGTSGVSHGDETRRQY